MEYRKVTAIVRSSHLEDIERRLRDIGVSGVSITRVSGYGEYHNFFQPDMMTQHARIEIFCYLSEAEKIACTIMEAAHIGQPGDGILAILPVEQLYRIRTKAPVTNNRDAHNE